MMVVTAVMMAVAVVMKIVKVQVVLNHGLLMAGAIRQIIWLHVVMMVVIVAQETV